MKAQELSIKGLKLITLKTYSDHRGFFTERYQKEQFEDFGLPGVFVQDNFSRSAPRVLRGLHYQFTPPQGKLVSCIRGKIFDVAIDVRVDSPTFGKYEGVMLDGNEPSLFWIPAGFAHGFCVVGDQEADVLYKVDNYYSAAGEAGLIWNDKTIDIQWPIKDPILSPKDAEAKTLAQYKLDPKFR